MGKYKSPFARKYAPDLCQQIGLAPDAMLAFVDGLNAAFMAHPGFKAVTAVGNIMGLVPLHTVQMVSGGVQLAAGPGSAGMSLYKTAQYLRSANERIFSPRGLRAQVCRTEKMLSQTGLLGELGDALVETPDPVADRMKVFGNRVMALEFADSPSTEPDG